MVLGHILTIANRKWNDWYVSFPKTFNKGMARAISRRHNCQNKYFVSDSTKPLSQLRHHCLRSPVACRSDHQQHLQSSPVRLPHCAAGMSLTGRCVGSHTAAFSFRSRCSHARQPATMLTKM